jgi:hypothetical protein
MREEIAASYVLRLVSPPGTQATADEATALALASAALHGGVVCGKYLEWSDPDANRGRGDDRCRTTSQKRKNSEASWLPCNAGGRPA